MSCRICLEEGGTFVHPCSCKGEVGNVHHECLTKWVEGSGHDYCEICRAEYNKQDKCSCNIPRFCSKICSCYMGEYHKLYSKIASLITGLTCIVFFVNPFEYLIIQTSITAFFCIMMLIYIYIFEKDELKDQIHNVAVVWKLAYSAPFFVNCLIFNLQFSQDCELGCGILHEICDEECPMWDSYVAKVYNLSILVIAELICLAIVVIIRSIVVGYYNFRKLHFVDTDESKPLLSSPSSSSSSSSSSSGDFSEASSTSVVLDLEGVGNTSVSAAD